MEPIEANRCGRIARCLDWNTLKRSLRLWNRDISALPLTFIHGAGCEGRSFTLLLIPPGVVITGLLAEILSRITLYAR